MRGRKLSSGLTAALSILAVTLFLTGTSAGQGPHNYKVIHSFNGTDGINVFPQGLTVDAAGNLYGVATALSAPAVFMARAPCSSCRPCSRGLDGEDASRLRFPRARRGQS
jgi:hypothetical protein